MARGAEVRLVHYYDYDKAEKTKTTLIKAAGISLGC